jgi:hypothetical protein
MQLSTHFDSKELEHGVEIPADCLPTVGEFCNLVLEPIRTFVDAPIIVTSGNRSTETNKAAHGKPNSEHMYTPEHCAADFMISTNFGKLLSMRMVFDWIRNNPKIPFHQVTLEHDAKGGTIIHISYNKAVLGLRQAFEGATHNAAPYTSWEVVAFQPEASSTGQENA